MRERLGISVDTRASLLIGRKWLHLTRAVRKPSKMTAEEGRHAIPTSFPLGDLFVCLASVCIWVRLSANLRHVNSKFFCCLWGKEGKLPFSAIKEGLRWMSQCPQQRWQRAFPFSFTDISVSKACYRPFRLGVKSLIQQFSWISKSQKKKWKIVSICSKLITACTGLQDLLVQVMFHFEWIIGKILIIHSPLPWNVKR